jgi:putative membrane protein
MQGDLIHETRGQQSDEPPACVPGDRQEQNGPSGRPVGQEQERAEPAGRAGSKVQRGTFPVVGHAFSNFARSVDSLMTTIKTDAAPSLRSRILWLAAFLAVFVWSGIAPKDRFTWLLEVLPAVAGLLLLAGTYRRFPLTSLSYILILIHCIVLMVGGHYTYAEVPLFDWLRDVFGWQRNNYDKLGHFAQGFVPAILAREILIRARVVNGRRWLVFLVLCFCLALSAFYELIEWWVALTTGDSAEAFLALQGYSWDTQSDMLYALIGAITALALLTRTHDRQLARLTGGDKPRHPPNADVA